MNLIKLQRQHQREINSLRKLAKKRRRKRITDKGSWKMLNSMSLRLKGTPYHEFLKTEYWKIVRVFVLRRDKFKCTQCESKEKLQVHHKTYKNHFEEHKHLKDLTTLCSLCHEKQHIK